MRTFRQLSYQERDKIYNFLCQGKSCKEIGVELGRHRSTIAREIRRNSDAQGYYLYTGQAQQQTDARKNRKKNSNYSGTPTRGVGFPAKRLTKA